MKLQKTTWGLAVTALVLGAFVAFHEIPRTDRVEELQSKDSNVFGFKPEEIQELTLEIPPKTLKFKRTGDSNSPWQMKEPKDVSANDAAISFLVNLIVEAKRDRAFTISPEQRAEYGLDKPRSSVGIQLKDGKKYQLFLGKSDFEDKSLYARINSPSQNQESDELEILLLSKDFQYAIEREPSEWEKKQEENELDPKTESNPHEESSKTEENKP